MKHEPTSQRTEQFDKAGYKALMKYQHSHNGNLPDYAEGFQLGAEWAEDNPATATMEQQQTWSEKTRWLIIDSKNRGSVQLELYPEKVEEFGGTAFIYALWVSPQYRRNGVAAMLLARAEQIAAEQGHESVCLEWYESDTPHEILDWYMRSGYNDKVFSGNGDYVLLEKQLIPYKPQELCK